MKKEHLLMIALVAIIAGSVMLWKYWPKLFKGKTLDPSKLPTVDKLAVNSKDTFPLVFGNKTPSEKVKDVQSKMNFIDYYTGNGNYQIEVDGLFGPQTSERLASQGYSEHRYNISKQAYNQIMDS